MTFIRDFLGNFSEFICIFFISHFFCNAPFKIKHIDILLGISIPLSVAIVSMIYPSHILATAQFLYLFYFLFFDTKESIFSRLLHFSLTCATLIIFQFFITFCLSFLSLDSDSLLFYILGNLLTFLALIIAFNTTHLNTLFPLIKNAKLPFRILFFDTYIIIIIIVAINWTDLDFFYRLLPSAVIILSFILIANACILYYDQKLDAEHKTLVSYQQNLPIYESLIQQIRANQHEYSNRIQTLQNLPVACHDYESLCNALKENTEQFDKQKVFKTYPLLQINMPLLAASLFSQYTNARKYEITIDFEINSFHLESTVPEYQLADYMCILTQNAIEACRAGDRIYATLNSSGGRVQYEIRNVLHEKIPMDELSKIFHRGYTTKTAKKENGEDHGMGLYYLRHDIEKRGGQVGVDQIPLENKTWIVFYIDV